MANKERMFRVLVIAISLKNNGIAHSKDEVAESLFSAPIAELVSGGYIEEVTDSKDEVADAKMEALKQDIYNKESEEEEEIDESETIEEKEEFADLNDIADSIPGGNKAKGKR